MLQQTKFPTKLALNFIPLISPHLTEDGMVASLGGVRQVTAGRIQCILNNGVENKKVWHCEYVKPRRSGDKINIVIKYVNST